MSYTTSELRAIFNKTGGRCHLCGNMLEFNNYGFEYSADAWEVDHVYPESKGGLTSLPNLKPACPSCNRKKSDKVL